LGIIRAREVNAMRQVSIVSIILILVLTGIGLTGSNPNVKVAVHVLPVDCDRRCSRGLPEITSPCDLETSYKGCGEVEFFPVLYDLNEFQGVEYSVVWPGPYSCAFSPCSFAHIGEIVLPGDWISQIWLDCQTGFAVITGWGRVSINEPGYICVTPVAHTGRIKVLDCSSGTLDDPVETYCAGVCGAEGDDPCPEPIVKATEPTTWGSIKGMFR
jgi:hypothetical protein